MSKRFSVSFLLLSFIVSVAFGRDVDIDALAASAAKEQKHLLVWLHKTDCGYCESMREFTLEDDKIAPMLEKGFVFEHINVYDNDTITYKSFKGNGKAFAKKVGYSFYPSSLFLDKDAEIVFAAPGYIEERDFAVMLKFVQSGAYKKMGYDCFRRQEEKH